jgi:peptide/nickel transport system substrate-binding protein
MSTILRIAQSSVALGDPHICSDFRDRRTIFAAIYESLVRRSASGSYMPALAERWQVQEDARTWVFDLRAGVQFHNGDLLSADDVVASFERVCDPALGGEWGTQGVYLSYLAGSQFRALSRYQVQIITAQPLADLLDLVVDIPIVARRALAGLPEAPIGTGAYQLASASSEQLVCQAFRAYWGRPAHYEQLVFLGEKEAGRRSELIISGGADLSSGLGPAEAAQLRETGFTVAEMLSGLCVILMLNSSNGACQDQRVRQALNYATNVPELIATIMQGGAEPLNGPLTRLHHAYDPSVPVYQHNPVKARQLLAEAGYANGIQIHLDIPTEHPDEAIPLAAALTSQWQAAGIETMVIQHIDRPGYAEMVRAKQIGDACLFDSSPLSSIRVLCEKIHSGLQGPWWQGYQNPTVDLLIDQARATTDDAARRALYQRAYGMIHVDAPWVFLYSPVLYYGVGPQMAGWQPGWDGLIKPSNL